MSVLQGSLRGNQNRPAFAQKFAKSWDVNGFKTIKSTAIQETSAALHLYEPAFWNLVANPRSSLLCQSTAVLVVLRFHFHMNLFFEEII